jgi:AcrR family transcriptional regulator
VWRLRAPRLPAAARREHLLDAAAKILLGDGFQALTMERVAERARVSKGLGYAYFDNAEDLALALYDREVGAVYRRVEEAMSGPGSFAARTRRALGAYFDVVAERGALFAVLQTNLSARRLGRSARHRLARFLDFWSRQIAAAFPGGLVPAAALAGMMLNAADAGARVWRSGRLPRAEVEQLCARFMLGGLRAARHRAR